MSLMVQVPDVTRTKQSELGNISFTSNTTWIIIQIGQVVLDIVSLFSNCQGQIYELVVLSRRFANRNKMQNTQCDNKYLLIKENHKENANK